MKIQPTIEIEVDRDRKECCGKGCEWMGLINAIERDCILFDEYLINTIDGDVCRCSACLAAKEVSE